MRFIDTTTNPFQGYQDLVAGVPEFLQPILVMLAGAVPFIEGEGAATIGILGGVPPIVAAIAAAAGNLLCVIVVVLVASRIRTAVTTRPGARTAAPSARREKFQKAYQRYGTPGVSLLGPLLLPTQFTAAALVATGVPARIVVAWQAVAIALWTTLLTLVATGVITALG